MDTKMVNRMLELAARTGCVLLATADESGLPHLAAAARLSEGTRRRLVVSEWFCPGTVANVAHNPRVSVVAWDPGTDEGVQVFGRVEKMDTVSVMNGYVPKAEVEPPIPQVERQLMIRVEKVVAFSRAPHSDLEPRVQG